MRLAIYRKDSRFSNRKSMKNKSILTTKEIFEHGNNNILYNLVRSKRQKTSELII